MRAAGVFRDAAGFHAKTFSLQQIGFSLTE
jgi:hypothetical protein